MEIPIDCGVGELKRYLSQAENDLSIATPKLMQYRIDENNAKAEYNYELAAAKVKYQNEKTATLCNCKAAVEPTVREKQLMWKAAEALLIMGDERVSRAQSNRDTLKCLIKSENISY